MRGRARDWAERIAPQRGERRATEAGCHSAEELPPRLILEIFPRGAGRNGNKMTVIERAGVHDLLVERELRVDELAGHQRPRGEFRRWQRGVDGSFPDGEKRARVIDVREVLPEALQ